MARRPRVCGGRSTIFAGFAVPGFSESIFGTNRVGKVCSLNFGLASPRLRCRPPSCRPSAGAISLANWRRALKSEWRSGAETLHETFREGVLHETAYLLARWRLSISTRGCCWIRPAGPTVSPEEIAGFVALFRRCCDAAFPRAIVFDLGRVRVVGEQWSLVYDLLQDFARELAACCRISCSRNGRTRAVIIARRCDAGPVATA